MTQPLDLSALTRPQLDAMAAIITAAIAALSKMGEGATVDIIGDDEAFSLAVSVEVVP
jgi:hypothetical protein